MAYIDIEIDIEDHLDEVRSEDLIEELERRKLNDDHRARLYKLGKPEENSDLNDALWFAQNGNLSEALLYIERALPQFKGLLWR
jgi:hypothetical protein